MRIKTGASLGSVGSVTNPFAGAKLTTGPKVQTKKKAIAGATVGSAGKAKIIVSQVTGLPDAEPKTDEEWLAWLEKDKQAEAQQKLAGAKAGGGLQARGPTWNMNSSPDQIITQSQSDKQAFMDQAAAANPMLNKISEFAKFIAPIPGLIPRATDILAGPAAILPRNENLTGMMAKPITPVAADPGRIVPGDALASGRILTHPDSTPLQRLLSGGELFVDAGAPGAGKAMGAIGRTPAVKSLFEALGILKKEIAPPPVVGADAFEEALQRFRGSGTDEFERAMAAKSAATAPVDPIAQEIGNAAKKTPVGPVQTSPSLQVKTGGATVRTKPKTTVPVDGPSYPTSDGAMSWLPQDARARINRSSVSELKKTEAELLGKSSLTNEETEILTRVQKRLGAKAVPKKGIADSAEVVINGKLTKLEGAELEAYRQSLKPKLAVVEGTGPKETATGPDLESIYQGFKSHKEGGGYGAEYLDQFDLTTQQRMELGRRFQDELDASENAAASLRQGAHQTIIDDPTKASDDALLAAIKEQQRQYDASAPKLGRNVQGETTAIAGNEEVWKNDLANLRKLEAEASRRGLTAKADSPATQPTPSQSGVATQTTRTGPKATGKKRSFQAGANFAEMQFASAEQERLYDLGAALKQNTTDAGRTQNSTVYKNRADRIANATPEDIAKATEVYNDVRAQMKGVKDGETRVLKEYNPAKESPPPTTPVVAKVETKASLNEMRLDVAAELERRFGKATPINPVKVGDYEVVGLERDHMGKAVRLVTSDGDPFAARAAQIDAGLEPLSPGEIAALNARKADIENSLVNAPKAGPPKAETVFPTTPVVAKVEPSPKGQLRDTDAANMTREEFVQALRDGGWTDRAFTELGLNDKHYKMVRHAAISGQDIPATRYKEYPNLAKDVEDALNDIAATKARSEGVQQRIATETRQVKETKTSGVQEAADKHFKDLLGEERWAIAQKHAKVKESLSSNFKGAKVYDVGWLRTQAETLGGRNPKSGDGKFLISEHRGDVERALAEGKPVPANVLKDYPDLATPKVETPSPVTPKPEAGRTLADDLSDASSIDPKWKQFMDEGDRIYKEYDSEVAVNSDRKRAIESEINSLREEARGRTSDVSNLSPRQAEKYLARNKQIEERYAELKGQLEQMKQVGNSDRQFEKNVRKAIVAFETGSKPVTLNGTSGAVAGMERSLIEKGYKVRRVTPQLGDDAIVIESKASSTSPPVTPKVGEGVKTQAPNVETGRSTPVKTPRAPKPVVEKFATEPTPAIIEQHKRAQAAHPEVTILTRTGDNYHAFGDDAKYLSEKFGVPITKMHGVQTASVPYQGVERYLAKMVADGRRTALAEPIGGNMRTPVVKPDYSPGPSVGPPKVSEGRIPVRGSMGPRYRFGSGRSRAGTKIFDPAEYAEIVRRAKASGVKSKAEFMEYVKRFDKSGDMSGWSEAFDTNWAKVAVKGAKPTTETDSQKKIDARVKQLEKQIKDLLDGTVKPERGKITSDQIKELVDQRDALKASINAANAPAPSTGAKVRASVKAVRLANPGNRAMDVASNTLSTTFEQVASTFDGAFDRLLFPKARITQGPASGVQWLSAWDSLKGARKRWGAEFKNVMKNGDPAILKKYNMVEAPGPLKYVQRFTGTTDIPFRDYVYQASKRELNRINPKLSAEAVEEIAMEEAARNTFMGDSWGTKLWDKFEEGVREVGGEAGLTLVDQLVPFPRVIGNIAGRTTDYLGLGLAKGASKAVKGSVTKTLDVAARREINRLMSRGLVGTGLLYAGARLYDAGLLNPVELNKQYGYADWGNYFGVFKPDQLGPQTAIVLLGAAWQAINKSDMTPKQKASMKAKIVMDVPMGTPVVGGMEKVGRFTGDPIGTTNKQLATVVIPSILNAIAEASDLDSKGQPVKRDTSPDRGLLAPYKKRIPVVRKTLPPK